MKAFLFAVLALPAALPAQQVVTLEVRGDAIGLDYLGNRSVTAVKVGNAPTIPFRFNPGDTPSVVAQRIAAGVGAQGVRALATGNTVRIVSGRNGGPLQTGVDFGTNDIGHLGLIATISGTAPNSVKTNGCTLPYVVGGPTNPRGNGGSLTVEVDVDRPGPAGQPFWRHTIVLPFGPNRFGRDISSLLAQALVADGLRVRGFEFDSVINQIGSSHEGIQIDRDLDGYPVRRVAYFPTTVPLDMRWMEVHAGREPNFGSTDYGQPWNSTPGLPLIVDPWGAPRIGTRFGVTAETGIPNQFVFLMLGWGKAEIPLPMLGQSALLVVDPAGSVVRSGIATAQGGFGYGISVPADPAFSGAHLYFQAADMSPFGGAPRLSPGLVSAIR